MNNRGSLAAVVLSLAIGLAGCSKSASQYLESGNNYVAQGKLKEAVVEYRNAIQKDPKLGDARSRLAETYARLGDGNAALGEFVRAADLLPENIDLQLKAGTLLLMAATQGNPAMFEDAKARAQKVIQKDPRNVSARILLGNAIAGMKDLDGAVAEIMEAIRLAPGDSLTYSNLGALQLAKGDKEEAEKAFRQAVEIAPKSVEVHLALGMFLWNTDRQSESESSFRRAHELEPANVGANRSLAAYLIAANRSAEAEPFLKSVAESTKDAEAVLALADYYASTRRSSDALRLLEGLTGNKGAFAEATRRIAAIQYAEGRTAEAHKSIDEAIARDANNSASRIVKAQFLLSERKLDEALVVATAAVALNPRYPAAHYVLGRIHEANNATDAAIKAFSEVLKLNPHAVSAQLEISKLALSNGAVQNAVDFAQRAVGLEPENQDARLALARSLLVKGDLAGAETNIKALMAKSPNSSAAHTAMGMLLSRKNDVAGARRSFTAALQFEPGSVEPLAGLTALDLAAKKVPDALARVEGRVAKSPDDPVVLHLAARTYLAIGDQGKAERVLRHVLDVAPENLAAYAILGQIFLAQQKLDDARNKFDEMARRQPRPVAALTMVGMIQELQNKPAEAQRSYERALEFDAHAPVAANNLAWLYGENGGNLDVALQLAQAAKAALPDSPEVNDTLGWIYFKKNLGSMAVGALSAAIDKNPRNPTYHYHLGMAYLRAGNKEKAVTSLQTAIQIDPTSRLAADARQALSTLR